MDIEFINEYPKFIFNSEELFSSKVSTLFLKEGIDKTIEICVVYMSNEQLLEINKEHLNHDYYTDIITFPIEESEEYLQADIYISIDMVKSNAVEFKVETEQELLRVVLHGCLHLCGYDDQSVEDKKEMRGKEDYYLSV